MSPVLRHLILLLIATATTTTTSLNITEILSKYPDLSNFTTLLTTSGIPTTLLHRTSLTILAVPNSHITTATTTSSLRLHILLQYLSLPDLRNPQNGLTLVPTLSTSSLSPSFDTETGLISFHLPNTTTTTNVLSLTTTLPHTITVLTVDRILTLPPTLDLNLTASESRPPPITLNITKALLDGHIFNVVTSLMTASGVIEEFKEEEGGAGITLFVPTDSAFAELPSNVELQALPADNKALLLKFHVLLSYYPLGSLESIVNPVQPTMATEDNGAGSFTLNISRVNGSVAINTGLVQAVVTQTVFDQNPVAIFGVSSVLLPKEMFGKGGQVNLRSGTGSSGGGGGGGGVPFIGTQSPHVGPAPMNTPDVGYDGPSHLSSPPGIASKGWCSGVGIGVMVLSCMGSLVLC